MANSLQQVKDYADKLSNSRLVELSFDTAQHLHLHFLVEGHNCTFELAVENLLHISISKSEASEEGFFVGEVEINAVSHPDQLLEELSYKFKRLGNNQLVPNALIHVHIDGSIYIDAICENVRLINY